MGSLFDVLLVGMGIVAVSIAFRIFRTKEYKTKINKEEVVMVGKVAQRYAIFYVIAGIGAIAMGIYGLVGTLMKLQ